MNPRSIRIALLSLFAVIITGCAIVQNVVPMPNAQNVTEIYVVHNPKVLMEGFIDEMCSQIRNMNINVIVVSSTAEVPKDTVYMTYTANWNWDMAMYLTFFEAKVYTDGRLLGYAVYDSRKGGANMGKFGTTAEKIRPLLSQLFLRTPAATMGSR